MISIGPLVKFISLDTFGNALESRDIPGTPFRRNRIEIFIRELLIVISISFGLHAEDRIQPKAEKRRLGRFYKLKKKVHVLHKYHILAENRGVLNCWSSHCVGVFLKSGRAAVLDGEDAIMSGCEIGVGSFL